MDGRQKNKWANRVQTAADRHDVQNKRIAMVGKWKLTGRNQVEVYMVIERLCDKGGAGFATAMRSVLWVKQLRWMAVQASGLVVSLTCW